MDNGYYNNGMNHTPNMNPQSAPEFTKNLTLSIVQLLCCNQITGVLAIIFTVLANSAFKMGNMIDYQSKNNAAKTTLRIGWIISAIIYGLIIVIYGFAIAAAVATEV